MGFLTGPGDDTTLLLGHGTQSALSGAAEGPSASTASRTIHLCTNTSQVTAGCAIIIKAETVCDLFATQTLLLNEDAAFSNITEF